MSECTEFLKLTLMPEHKNGDFVANGDSRILAFIRNESRSDETCKLGVDLVSTTEISIY